MPHYADLQIQTANQCDIAAFLLAQGETLKKQGRQFVWQKHQVWIDGCRWYSHYDAHGAYAIKFVMHYFGQSFQEAIQSLTGGVVLPEIKKNEIPKLKSALVLPKPNATLKRVYAYLLENRCIDREVISYFTHEKVLYEDAQYHNCIFLGLDENGVPKHCHRRSTAGNFKQTERGSLAEYAFHHDGTSEWIFVFEAPIDMLAFLSMHKNDWQNHSYVALCSVSERALLHRLEVNPKLQKIVLCLDNDDAGRAAMVRIRSLLQEREYKDVRICTPRNKDWDEDLKELKKWGTKV